MTLEELLSRIGSLPWPVQAKEVGDFALYETLLIGCVQSFLEEGKVPKPNEIPIPDPATLDTVKRIQGGVKLSDDDREFRNYYNLLEQLRNRLAGVE